MKILVNPCENIFSNPIRSHHYAMKAVRAFPEIAASPIFGCKFIPFRITSAYQNYILKSYSNRSDAM